MNMALRTEQVVLHCRGQDLQHRARPSTSKHQKSEHHWGFMFGWAAAKFGSEPLIPVSGVSGLGPGCVFTDVKRREI